MYFLPTVGTAQSWSQVWPDEEGWQVGCQVEVSLWVRILRQRQVLHQVIVSGKTSPFGLQSFDLLSLLLTKKSTPRGNRVDKEVIVVDANLEGIRAMNSSPDGQSFSL